MWRKLWRWLKQIYQSLQQRFQKPEPPPPPPRRQIPDIEFETKFMPLLEAVANGASGGEIQAQRMTTGIKAEEWIPWLQRFGEQLQQNPETHAEIAQRLVQFGTLHRGELGTVAERIGRQILAQIPPPVVEEEAKDEGQETDEAEKWFQRGNKQFDSRNFTDAIASSNEAIRLHPDVPYTYYCLRGAAQGNLGQYEDAIASYNEAIRLQPDFPDAYNNRGSVYYNVGKYEDAIASFDEAIYFKPDYSEAYFKRGAAQYHLRKYKDAIASFDEAIRFKPDYSDAYFERGLAQRNLRQYEDAIASFTKAIHLKPDLLKAYVNRGVVLCDDLGQYEDAIASFNEAIRLKRDLPIAYNNRGVAQYHLGKYEDAIASFNEAICLKRGLPYAYTGLGLAQQKLGQHEDAIASCDFASTLKRDIWQAWVNRGNAAGSVKKRHHFSYVSSDFAIQNPGLNEREFEGAMASYQEGLKYCRKDTHPQGWGMLHFEIGKTYYDRSRQKKPTTPQEDQEAAHEHYNFALETLTETTFPEAHLEVLRRLIRLLLGWKQTEQAQELKRRGTDVVRRLVEGCPSPGKQRQLALEFADFNQLTVDLWVQQKDVVQALEVAEAGKNACLSWLLYGRGDAVREPSWQQIRQLVGAGTAAVYWHLSPYALTTFILKPDVPEPQVLQESRFQDQSGYLGNLQELEDWIEDWNREYSRDKGNKTSTESESWRKSLPQQLDRLSEILQISAILEELHHCQGYHRLILIPHKDLHRLPLNALFLNQHGFAESSAITYLPSAVFGLSLLDANPSHLIGSIAEEEALQPDGVGMGTNEEPPQPPLAKGGLCSSILSIENPKSLIKDRDGSSKSLAALPAADAESEMISRLFPASTRLGETEATNPAVIAALQQSHTVMHFTGHGEYESAEPLASKLFLSGEDRLQVKDIIKLNLHSYQLISLSACETAVTGNPTITSEYVGLTSAFLRSGVGSVLSTLWQVQSDASTLFALYFYQQLQQGHPYPVAFTATQKWLKGVTKEDLSRWYQQQIEQLEQKPELSDGDIRCLNYFEGCRNGLATMGENLPFSDPYHWSPFTLYGL